MFTDIGNKVKRFAIILCVLGMIGSLVGAIVLWVNDLIGAGIATLLGGCLSSWIGSLIVYCIGDTNIKIGELKNEVSYLKKQRATENSSVVGNKITNTPLNSEIIKSEQDAPVPKNTMKDILLKEGMTRAIWVNEEKEKCESCGTIQNAGRNVCWNCGLRFQRDKEE